MPTLLALSGGADSVYLLLHAVEHSLHPIAVHVNHALRGAESDADEAFVRQLCQRLGVPLLCYRAAPPEHPSEDWARSARYAFFRRAMKETGAEAIMLAHHRDDQAETLLMHLLRGAGLDGLTGMASESTVDGMRILRPLLHMSREEIHAELKKRGQDWREDSSNQDQKYLRNALRQDILPRLEALIPGAGRRIAATAGMLREDARALDALAQDILGDGKQRWIPLDRLLGQPPAIQSRVIRRWVEAHLLNRRERRLNELQTRMAMAALDAPVGSRVNLPGELQLYRGWTHLHILGGGRWRIPCEITREPFAGDWGDGKRSQAIPKEIEQQAVLRCRQPGDYIRPFGMQGRQSLQDYFVNRHVDEPFRDMVPVLCLGQEVILAWGVGAGEAVRGRPGEAMIMLRYAGEMPWAEDKNGGKKQ